MTEPQAPGPRGLRTTVPKALLLLGTAGLLVLASACGDDEADPPAPAADDPGTAASPTPSPAAPGAGGDATALSGTVGEQGDPDAFTIELVDADGAPVASLPAGSYEITVTDLSAIHNFRLRGPDVDESTTVPGTGTTTWQVTLSPGEHTYLCEPHSQSMVGTFEVT